MRIVLLVLMALVHGCVPEIRKPRAEQGRCGEFLFECCKRQRFGVCAINADWLGVCAKEGGR